MDPSILKKTQDTLGKAIKKPPLTEKLLNKPPFRFLHDILTEVIKTGLFKGLYTDHELNSSNVNVSIRKALLLSKGITKSSVIYTLYFFKKHVLLSRLNVS